MFLRLVFWAVFEGVFPVNISKFLHNKFFSTKLGGLQNRLLVV